MTPEIPKNYDPASIETEANRVWLEEKCFAADPSKPGKPYCIVIPPPNVTGALHLGHAINNTLQDVMIRNHRMRGFNTLWVPGIDHAGIGTQAVVEKQLKEIENKTRHDLGRDELVRRIWQWKEKYGDRILEQIKRMGCSVDWDRLRFTLDEQCARAVRETFFKLFKDGLIFRGKRLVNWDVHLQTSISDDEIYHETVKTSMWHIRYPISGTDKSMVVATTRPETMLGDTAVAVHSQDSRWNWAIGKTVDLPLTGRKIPIIADDILVDPKFGSGVVKVTPAHDPNDYAVWQRHQGKPDQIDILNILNSDGTINDNGGKYSGMKRDAARKKVVEDLEALGLMVKEEPYETQVGHSDRSKTPVEPYLSDQWFVKMAPLAEPALQVVRDGTIKFFPERHAQQYLSWLGEKRDWPISRQLWWGHRIPVWTNYAKDFQLNELFTFGSEKRSRTMSIKPALCDHVSFQAETSPQGDGAIYRLCVAPGHNETEQLLQRLGFEQDPDVLDTWFSSALWPHSTLGWPEDTPDLQKWYPTSVLATGRDIITLWVARMVMTGMYNMGQHATSSSPSPGTPAFGSEAPFGPRPQDRGQARRGEGRGEGRTEIADAVAKRLGIPFHHVYIHPTILDGKGERMSKSKGNGVDPLEIVETHGADAMRFTLTLMATETQDVRMPVKKDAHGRNTSDKFDIGRFFCNKIWNVANHFVIANLANVKPVVLDESKWSLADRWIVSRFNRTVAEADAALEAYRFDQYAKICYDFFWEDFCSWYVEASKPAMKDHRAGQTANVLAAVLDGALRLMHPMVPFITETIWWKLNEVRADRGLPGWIENPGSNRLIHAPWPKAGKVDDQAESDLFPRIRKIITEIRRLRTDYKVDDKKSVSAIIGAKDSNIRRQIEKNLGMIELLANCSAKIVAGEPAAGEGSAHASTGDCTLIVENLVDPDVERQRTTRRKEELTRQKQTLGARLANAAYISKAPPNLVQQTRDQLAEIEAELGKLG